ncbi:unnamed protein product [Rhizopus stolonifer]
MYLTPFEILSIPSHPAVEGWDSQKLAIEKHVFPATTASPQQKIVFLFSHANGFHKEIYHPVIRRLLNHLRSLKEYDSIEIHVFTWDARIHGDSARLNQDKYNLRYRWVDNALDTKQVIDQLKLKENYDQLIGVGHSFGATSMVLLEFYYPRTFDGVCLIEPVLRRELVPMEIRLKGPFFASIKRRDEWHNREECLQSLIKRSFWRSFHPEALNNYVNYGMYETGKGTIKLKCPKEHEQHMYFCTAPEAFSAFTSSKTLQIPVHVLFATRSSLLDKKLTEIMIQSNSKNITAEYMEGTHMLPFELPDNMIPHIMKLIRRVNNENPKLKSKL